jgi:hypothetical protein
MKTVIQVWVNDYYGIGDILRGTIKLYQLSKKLNFNYIVDIQHHPISNFLINNHHEFSDFIKEKKGQIFYVINSEEHILNSKEDIIYFITNDGYHDMEFITEDCKTFIKNILTPNNEFSKYIEEKKKMIPFDFYNILHFRLGDEQGLVSGNFNSEEHMFFKLQSYIEGNDILLTDNNTFKKYVKEKSQIFSFDIPIAHSSYHKELEELKDTFFEFILLTKAKRIKSYCVYLRFSGFVLWISQIYDIELVKIPNY